MTAILTHQRSPVRVVDKQVINFPLHLCNASLRISNDGLDVHESASSAMITCPGELSMLV